MLPNTQVIESNGMKYMLFDSKDFISHIVRITGQFESDLVQATEQQLQGQTGGVVLDIGANLGTYSVPFAKRNPDIEVISFEPQKAIYHQLCGNIALNSLDNVTAYNVAVGDTVDTIEMVMPDYMVEENIGGFSLDPLVKEKTPTTKGQARPVDIVTVDSLGLTDVVALKIDVEGLELAVLKGAEATLKQSKYPPIIFEAWNQYDWWEKHRDELFAYLESLNYVITPITPLLAGPTINNFIAVQKEIV